MKLEEHSIQTGSHRLRIPDGIGSVSGVELAYWVKGRGEPVVFLHGGMLTDWFSPLADELSKTGNYQLISYHRPGYGRSTLPFQPITMVGQAECCVALLRHLRLEKAHLGALHRCLYCAPSRPAGAGGGRVVGALGASRDDSDSGSDACLDCASRGRGHVEAGRRGGDAFMRGIVDPDYEGVLDATLGTWREDALKGTDSFFQTDQPAVQTWRFEGPEAARVRQPVILFLGENSTRVNAIREPVHRTLLSWLPNAEGLTLEGASHLLPLQEPATISAALTELYRDRVTTLHHWDG